MTRFRRAVPSHQDGEEWAATSRISPRHQLAATTGCLVCGTRNLG